MADQDRTNQKTSSQHNAQHAMWRKQKEDRHSNYCATTNNNVGVAATNIKLREQTESHIKKLEEIES